MNLNKEDNEFKTIPKQWGTLLSIRINDLWLEDLFSAFKENLRIFQSLEVSTSENRRKISFINYGLSCFIGNGLVCS